MSTSLSEVRDLFEGCDFGSSFSSSQIEDLYNDASNGRNRTFPDLGSFVTSLKKVCLSHKPTKNENDNFFFVSLFVQKSEVDNNFCKKNSKKTKTKEKDFLIFRIHKKILSFLSKF